MEDLSPSRVETLYGTLARHAKSHPHHNAIIVNGNALSYRDLLQRVDAMRAAFTERAQTLVGERINITDVKKLDLLVGVLAATSCGGIAVLATGHGPAIIADCEPTLVVTSESPAETIAGRHQYVTPAAANNITAAPDNGCRVADANEPAMILYTSGTTSGIRRGVVLTHGMLSYTTDYMNDLMALDETVREYVVSPIDHSFGFARCRAVLRVGGTLVFDDGLFNPARVLLSVDRHRCNSVTSVSAGFAVLLQRFEKHLAKLGARILWSEIGSLPLPVDLKRRMLTVMPKARIFMHYGLTEASRTTLLDLRRNQNKLESVGTPAPGVEVRIADDGEILVRGPNVTPSYWRREDEWLKRFRDGWLYTGDLGRMDDDGFLFVMGRKDDVINVGGEKFLPNDVEDALRAMLTDRIYCVVGVPDPAGVLGEVPVLVIEEKSNVTLGDVRQFLHGRVPDYTMPRRLIVMEEIPRTNNGKIQRLLIRRGLVDDAAA